MDVRWAVLESPEMTQDSPNPSVVFEAAVFENFTFLEQEFGFSKSVSRPNQQSVIVRYENRTIYVNLMFGPPAYEPEMSFGRLGIDDVPGSYSLEGGDLIQLGTCRDWSNNNKHSGSVTGRVVLFASLLNECGRPCLNGDSPVYSEMKARRDAAVSIWHREMRDKARASKSNAAWEAKDYQAFIDLLSTYEGALSAIDQKRLDIARERLSLPNPR
jgi:hypothetical protein